MAGFWRRGQVALWKKERKDTATATMDEAAVEKEQARAAMDFNAFRADLGVEARLIDSLEMIRNQKFEAAKKVFEVDSAIRRLAPAKKQVLLRIRQGQIRVKSLYTKLGVGWGVGRMDPGFRNKALAWNQEIAKELELLEKESALSTSEEQQEIRSVAPIIQLNRELREKVKSYTVLLTEQDRRLIDAVNMEMQEIKNSRDQLRREKEALQLQIAQLKMSRGAVGSFSPQP